MQLAFEIGICLAAAAYLLIGFAILKTIEKWDSERERWTTRTFIIFCWLPILICWGFSCVRQRFSRE